MTDLARSLAAPRERIAHLLGCGVSAALVDRLLGSSRLKGRVGDIVGARLGECGPTTPAQADALAMLPEALLALASRAGVVWWSGAIAQIIDRPSLRTFVEALGEENYSLALTCQGKGRPVDGRPPKVETVIEAVARDGAASLAAWCEAQPAAIAARLRLLRPEALIGADHLTHGPPIVAWLLDRRP